MRVGLNAPMGRVAGNEINFRRLFENAPIAMHQLDAAGRILDVNKAWLKMLDYRKNEVISKPFTDFLPEEERENAFARFKARLEGDKVPPRIGDRHYLKKNGTLVVVRTKDTILNGRKNAAQRVISAIEDITPYRKMENERIANALLASGVTVASNTIDGLYQRMQGIEGSAQLVEMFAEKDPEKTRKYARIIVSEIDEVKKLFALVREQQGLLSLLQNGTRQDEFVQSDILIALTGARHRALDGAQNKASKIDLTSEGDLPQLKLHPKFKDAIYYILKSSLALPQPGESRSVKVKAKADNNGVTISITDDRKRDEPVTTERLEEPPFRHGLTHLYTEYLELSVALLCIKLHGGTMNISTQTVSDKASKKTITTGTTFNILLPPQK